MMNSQLLPPKVEPSEAAELILNRRTARKSLEAFTRYTFADYQPVDYQIRLCQRLDRFVRGETKRLIISMPPRHSKTEHCSRRLPAFLFGLNPDEQIMACSHTHDLASEINRDVQRIMDGEEYRRLFPRTQLGGSNIRTVVGSPLRNSDTFEIVGRKGRYKNAGVGGNIVGRGFTVGIIDDAVKSRAEADSPAFRDKVWNWYLGDFYTRRAPGARILIVMTRWHEDDLVGRLLKMAADDPAADQWEVITLPAINEAGPSEFDPRQVGEPLWPERYGLADLEKVRAASPYDWFSQYQQRPRVQGSVEWPDEYFPPSLWFDLWPRDLQCRILALDPSKGRDAKSGDYSAYVMLGFDRAGTAWVDADLERRPVDKIVRDGLTLFRSFHPDAFAVETNSFQELLGPEFLRAAKAEGINLPLFGINNVINKIVRIRSIGAWLAQGRMRFKAESPGARLLWQQLREFPASAHDDGPDALAMALKMLDHWLGDRAEPNQPRLVCA